jgi:hypothetical protein
MTISFTGLFLILAAAVVAWYAVRWIRAIAFLAIIGLMFAFLVVPYLKSSATPLTIHEYAIKGQSRRYARAAVDTITRENKPVMTAAKKGALNLDDQRGALLKYGDTGRQQVQNEQEALDHLYGRTYGDVSMPVNTDVDEDEPLSWYDTGKELCQPTVIEVWGTATHDPAGYALHKWVGPLGWQDATPKERENFRENAKVYRMLVPEQPFMAALGRLGLHGTPFIFDEKGPDGHFQKTVRPNGCQKLYTSVNGFTRLFDWETGRPGIHLSDLARQRKGGFELKVIPLEERRSGLSDDSESPFFLFAKNH